MEAAALTEELPAIELLRHPVCEEAPVRLPTAFCTRPSALTRVFARAVPSQMMTEPPCPLGSTRATHELGHMAADLSNTVIG